MIEIERIKRNHSIDERRLNSGEFIGIERLRATLIIAHQERTVLLAEVERLEAENAVLGTVIVDASELYAEMENNLQAEAAALREALGAVEWVFRTGTGYCPWCEKPFKSGHAADCPRQLALAADAGRALLAENVA